MPRQTLQFRDGAAGGGLPLMAYVISGAGTITGNWVPLGSDSVTQMAVLLNVLTVATAAGDTLDVFIDMRLPDGTAVNLIHFPSVLGNGGAKKFMAVATAQTAATTITDVTADAAANVLRLIGVAESVRARIVTVNGTTALFSFNLTADVN